MNAQPVWVQRKAFRFFGVPILNFQFPVGGRELLQPRGAFPRSSPVMGGGDHCWTWKNLRGAAPAGVAAQVTLVTQTYP